MTNWAEIGQKYYLQSVRRPSIIFVRGEGPWLWDEQGKRYLDFVAGWAVNCLGHCPPVMVNAITEQAKTLIHGSAGFYNIPQLKLAQLLVDNSALDRIFFANSGAEANEGACKLARKYGKKNRNGAYEVITALNSFHGRTLAMTAATGQKRYHEPFEPVPAGFVNVPFNDIEAIQTATSEKTCAVMLEPVQGEGGVNIPSDDYLKQVRAWCDAKGLLLILDEVQTGVGRIGTLFGYESYGVEPDVMTLAKGMGGGVPIGAFLVKERAAVLTYGEHGSTYGGNALVTAAAYAVAKHVIDNKLWDNAQNVGEHLLAGLRGLKHKYDFVTDVRGKGLLAAIEFNRDLSDGLVPALLEEGLIVNPVKPNALRLMPPLNISNAEADEAVAMLDKVLAMVGT